MVVEREYHSSSQSFYDADYYNEEHRMDQLVDDEEEVCLLSLSLFLSLPFSSLSLSPLSLHPSPSFSFSFVIILKFMEDLRRDESYYDDDDAPAHEVSNGREEVRGRERKREEERGGEKR